MRLLFNEDWPTSTRGNLRRPNDERTRKLKVLFDAILMEGLSVGASVIAVVSIAIQLTDSLKKFSDFIDSIKEAPKDVESVLSELRFLSSILEQIRLQPSSPLNTNSTVANCLTDLQRKITTFETLANRYRPGLNSQNRRIQSWNALKVAFKSEVFKKYRNSLNQEKINLILALQVFQ